MADPTRPGKRAYALAGEIEKEIARLGWPVGTVLGGEEALVQRYAVSRAVFRESVRILESRWVARMRPGPGGGLVVTTPDSSAVRDLVRMYLGFKRATPEDLVAAWAVLQLASVAQVAASVDEVAAARLREVVGSEDDDWRPRVRNLHGTIAELSGNPALELFTEVVLDLALETLEPEREPSSAWLDEQHRALVSAVVAGDAGLAQLRLRHYLTLLVRPESAPPDGDLEDAS